MKYRVVSAAVLVLSIISSAEAQDVKYEKYRLENGMTVILHEDHSLPVACINLWYYVGSKDEAAGRSGFAHLFEHLMFMGTNRVPGGDFDTIMESGGGWNNASTSRDRTNYFSFGPSNLLPRLLWLDADRLEDLGEAMTQEKLDKQRAVVRNERRQTSEMRPYGKADLKVNELMYPPGHPYHIDVIGSHEDLQAATLQDVKGPGKGAGKVCQGMIKIRARGNESVEQMLRRFKKMCEKEGLNKQIKKNSYYEKPSERRRRRIRKAVARRERTART